MSEEICGSGVLRVPGFEVAAATYPGRPHQVAGRNNQDDAVVLPLPDGFVAVVCDGCGSEPRSEVGAILGAKTVACVVRALAEQLHADGIWDIATNLVVKHLGQFSKTLPAVTSGGRAVLDHLMFTTVGAVVAGGFVRTFSCGDGVIAINGEQTILAPLPGNQPPYLSYGLFGAHSLPSIPQDVIRLRQHHCLPVADVSTLMIGTDGALDLAALADESFPGTQDCIGDVSAHFAADATFSNPDALRRWLARIGRDKYALGGTDWNNVSVRYSPGMLRDDTTIVLARRTKETP